MGGSISLSRVSTLRVDFHMPESRFQYTLLFMFRPLSIVIHRHLLLYMLCYTHLLFRILLDETQPQCSALKMIFKTLPTSLNNVATFISLFLRGDDTKNSILFLFLNMDNTLLF